MDKKKLFIIIDTNTFSLFFLPRYSLISKLQTKKFLRTWLTQHILNMKNSDLIDLYDPWHDIENDGRAWWVKARIVRHIVNEAKTLHFKKGKASYFDSRHNRAFSLSAKLVHVSRKPTVTPLLVSIKEPGGSC